MTEYGRGPGSEPWHPEDPLYGDQGWEGQQAAAGQSSVRRPAAAAVPAAAAAVRQTSSRTRTAAAVPAAVPAAAAARSSSTSSSTHQQQQYHQQQYTPAAVQRRLGHRPAAGHAVRSRVPADPYGGQQPGYVRPAGRRLLRHARGLPAAAAPGPRGRPSRSPRPDRLGPAEAQPEETHPFFTGDDGRDDDDEYDDDPATSRAGAAAASAAARPKKKSRNGCACLVVALVLVGRPRRRRLLRLPVLAGPVRRGRRTTRARAAAQVAGRDPQGRGLGSEIGNILKKAGVVKSADAFVAAPDDEPQGQVDPGRRLPAEEGDVRQRAPSTLMLDPASQQQPDHSRGQAQLQGLRADRQAARLKAGTTKDVAKAKAKSLGLPAWADDNKNIKDPLEGFLFPATLSGRQGHEARGRAAEDGRPGQRGVRQARPRGQGRRSWA